MNNKKMIRRIFPAALVMAIAGCDGISGTGGPSRVADDPVKQTPQDGQAVLGPIVGAEVIVRDIEALDTVACSTTTQDNNDLLAAGGIHFNEPCIFANHLYLVTIKGGDDIDFDDDGNRDTTPTPNTGEFRALLSGAQLLQSDWKTNALTEAAYQAIQYRLQEGSANITALLADIARQYIQTDLNADGTINWLDIAVWSPHDNATDARNADKLRFSTELIHQNLNRTLTNIPDAPSLAEHIDTLAPARQVMIYNNSLLVTTDTALLIYHRENGINTLQSTLPLGWVYDMTLSGSNLFVALGENGVKQLDISDPTNIRISNSWPDHAERIASIGTRVVFSVENAPYQQSLKTISDAGETDTLATVNQVEGGRIYLGPDWFQVDLHQPLLRVADGTVYWAPANSVLRYTLQNNEWIALTELVPDIDQFNIRIIKDIEVNGAKLYVVETGLNTGEKNWLLDVPPVSLWRDSEMFGVSYAEIVRQFFALMENRTVIMDISNPGAPVGVLSTDVNGVDALRKVNGIVVGLGKTDISIRNADTLQAESSLPLPASFSGFYPAHGLASIDNLIVVAAKENGILLLDPNRVPEKIYHGETYIDGPLTNADIVVRQLPTASESCRVKSDDAGAIALPANCVEVQGYYDIDVSGGAQIVDGISTPFSGHMHSVVHSSLFQYNHWAINPITTLARDALSTTVAVDLDAVEHGYEELQYWWINSMDFKRRLNEELPADSYQVSLDAQKWQQIKQSVVDGNYNGGAALIALTGASSFRAFESPVQGVAAADSALFVARNNSVDIYDASPATNYVGALSNVPGNIAASGDALAAFDHGANTLRIYDASDVHNVVLANTISTRGLFDEDVTLLTKYDSLYTLPAGESLCFAGDILYDIKKRNATTVVNAWRISAGTLELAATRELSYRVGDVSGCRGNRIVVTRSDSIFDPRNFHDFELITLQNNAFISAGLVEVPHPEGTFSNEYVTLVQDEIYAKNCQSNYVTDTVTNSCYIYQFSVGTDGAVNLGNTIKTKLDSYYNQVLLTDSAIFTADGGLVDVLDKTTSHISYVARIAPTVRYALSSRNVAWFLSDFGLWTYPSAIPGNP